jgi:hypothetical protein
MPLVEARSWPLRSMRFERMSERPSIVTLFPLDDDALMKGRITAPIGGFALWSIVVRVGCVLRSNAVRVKANLVVLCEGSKFALVNM